MKLMMKKWFAPMMIFSLALFLTIMTPFNAFAEGDETESETEPTKTAAELLSGYTLTLSKTEFVWTGKAIEPKVSLTADETAAEEDAAEEDAAEEDAAEEDTAEEPVYTIGEVTYQNNTSVGKATVTAAITVEGCSDTVTKEAEFSIIPAKATGTKVTKTGTTSLTVSCDAMPSAMKKNTSNQKYRFELMTYSGGAWTVAKAVTNTNRSVIFSNLKSGHSYAVRAYYVVKGTNGTVKGKASAKVYAPTAPAAVKKAAAVKTGAKAMKVTWKKVSGATGYKIEYSTTSTFKKKTVVTVKGGSTVSKVIKGLARNGGYYVRVCAYHTTGNKVTADGEYSNVAYTKPEAAKTPSFVSRTTSSLKVKCAAAKTSGCHYEFRLLKYNTNKKKWVKASDVVVKTNQTTFTGLDAGRNYKVLVRYAKKATSNSDYCYGEWSTEKEMVTTPSQVTLNSVVKTSSKKLKATWTAVSYGSGYELQYATKSSFKGSKTVTVNRITRKSVSAALSADKTCYARVRAFVTLNGKKIYGQWSAAQSTYYSNVYATYSTTYSSSNYNRTCNLIRACSEIDGTILAPGETFSFNNVVGPRTTARGYKEAIVYSGGTEVLGVGGGICQVASTLFNAALKANFTIVERHQHSMTVHYVPLGYDAAMAGTAKTLRFTNNLDVPVKISAKCSGGTLTMTFLTNTYKKAPKVTTSVSVSNRVYTLRRYVNGKCNYVTTSKYSDI